MELWFYIGFVTSPVHFGKVVGSYYHAINRLRVVHLQRPFVRRVPWVVLTSTVFPPKLRR